MVEDVLMLDQLVTVFFRTVAHKLYGDPYLHPLVWSVRFEYLRLNLESFIESHLILSTMSPGDTWADKCDYSSSQADSSNLSIRIVGPNELHVSFLDYFNRRKRNVFISPSLRCKIP